MIKLNRSTYFMCFYKQLKNILLSIFFLFSLFSFSQNSKIDSLCSILKTTKSDTNKVNLLNTICDFYLYYLPPRAANYANEALTLSLKQNYQNGIAESYRNLGFADFRKDNYKQALNNTNRALQIFEKTKNKIGIRNCYYQLSLIYTGQGDFNIAMKYSLKSLKLCQESNDTIGEARTYYRMGTINRYMENYSIAVSYLKKSIDLMVVYKDIELGMVLYRLGDVYGKKGNEKFAVEYYTKSLFYSRILFNRNSEAYALYGLGNHYFNNNNFLKALDYYNNALAINEMHENYWAMIRNNLGIGTIYFKTGENNKALKHANKSLEFSKKINDKYGIQSAYKLLYQIYEMKHDINNAFLYHKLYSDYNDSVFNINISSSIAKMQINFENEKEKFNKKKEYEKQQVLAQEQIKKQKIIIYFSMAGGVLLLLLLLVVYYSYNQKQKSNLELSVKNKKIELAHKIIEEKTQEMTDSINYAKRIQQAVMPSLEIIPNTEYFVLFRPKDIVSGDFYWSTHIDKMLIITVADCTGHGVPGAFMSMLGISFLNEIIRKKEVKKAADVLDQLRTSIIEALKQKGDREEQKDGMDIAFCIINTETLEMQFAGANNPVYIVTQFENMEMNQFGNVKTETSQFSNFQINTFSNLIEPVTELVEVKGDKQPIGIHSHMQPFTNQIYQLQKGDSIYLMSDGYEDQFGGPNRKKFLSKNLKNLLTANSHLPMANQKQTLETNIIEWIGSREQIDDITILGIKI